ncbi:hypothetical protein GCM10023085_74690 [Actinomadura viridis]|uniref:Uncharacterized protein n=1 Tax=Actinomadura viridis TaxID=58110 RepID=A0A931GGS3_9ACTN|nr:hypothetical protein [Actinomadura viridis]MBG6086645.1 hypothetical protein [Actinomadura viridis]
MSGGARHGLGVVIGLIVTPLIAGCLMYGTERTTIYIRTFMDPTWSKRILPVTLLLLAALLLGLVMGSRISPVASLIPGLAFLVPGALWMIAPAFSVRTSLNVLPGSFDRGYTMLGPTGFLMVLGVALVVASLAPSRWRSAPRAQRQAPAPAPGGPYGGQPVPGGPYGTPPAPGQYHPQPGGQPFSPGPAPGPGSFPAPPGAPPAPHRPQEGQRPGAEPEGPQALPAGSPEPQRGDGHEKPGEWTQMYGGSDLRGGQDGQSGEGGPRGRGDQSGH